MGKNKVPCVVVIDEYQDVEKEFRRRACELAISELEQQGMIDELRRITKNGERPVHKIEITEDEYIVDWAEWDGKVRTEWIDRLDARKRSSW